MQKHQRGDTVRKGKQEASLLFFEDFVFYIIPFAATPDQGSNLFMMENLFIIKLKKGTGARLK